MNGPRAGLAPAIELLGAVDLLGPGGTAPRAEPDRGYARTLERACAPFRAHPAVKLNASLHASDPDFFQRKDLLLKRSSLPGLKRDKALSSITSEIERSGTWDPWLAAMSAFARDSRFLEVFASAAPLWKPQLDALRRHLANADYVGKLERYTGMPFDGRYRLIVSSLCVRGRGLNRVWTRDDGRREIISILKPETAPSGERTFVDDGLDAVAWHELCHGIMDATVDFHDLDKKGSPLDLGPGLGNNCRDWLHGMREHLVRAVMLRLIARERSEAAAAKQYGREEFSRQPYLEAFLDRLREYEASRRRYPTLADFYPRLREVFAPPVRARSSKGRR